MRNFIDSLKARRDAAKNEGGFSLIDVVVTVAIIVALSVGGFVTYTGIVNNAKAAATASAADQVYTAAVVAANDGKITPPATDQAGEYTQIETDYNTSSKGVITVDIATNAEGEITVTATHEDDAIAPVVRG